MPKNKGAGGKKHRKTKGFADKPKELIYKTKGEEYGKIIKSLGNGFMEIHCFDTPDGTIRRGHIRGKMRKRVWMGVNDIVLVSIRDYQDNTCDIILKYTADEARILRARKEIPDDTSNEINMDDNNLEENFENNLMDEPDLIDEPDQIDEPEKSDDDDLVPNQNRKLEYPDSDNELSN